ncbi:MULTISPECIES: phage holin family protein [unclassified Agrococcus]|uniref:phage holin family protein n=1 Tax=unclassified Agrococcus TaxID=2615065 RepID=UPI003617E551
MRFLLRLAGTALAIWVVTLIVPGIHIVPWEPGVGPEVGTLLLVAVVFGVINATIGNLIRIVAFPIYLLTLGIAALFVNALLLMSVHWISEAVGFGLRLDGFWWGFLSAILISFGTWLVTVVTKPLWRKDRKRDRD